MQIRKYSYLIPVLLGVLLLSTVILLLPGSKASAQCGSQASSCKNCHETQAQDPVNTDGTGWHQSHAFGDFCYICHAGNNQSMDKATAHTGMVAPLSDVKAACQQCHPDDLQARAQVYATALGVEIGGGSSATPGAGSTTGEGSSGGSPTSGEPAPASGAPAEAPGEAAAPAAPAMVVSSPEVIDYNQRYTGQTSVNWGNVILAGLIVLVAVGGGLFVFWNERRLRGLSGKKVAKAAASPAEMALPEIEGYSSEVVALLPSIAALNPLGLHALQRILENPQDASELLYSLSKMDPDLVKKVRSLDRQSRAILLAMSGD